jgi:hypothetical protein
MRDTAGPSVSVGCRATIILALALSTLTLAACSGGGQSANSTDAAPVAPTTTSGAITVPGKPARNTPRPILRSAARRALSRGAAGFRVPRGDNSIPDFGQEADATQRQLALNQLTAFMRARAKGEWSKACDYLARPTRRQLESFAKRSGDTPNGCGPVFAALMSSHEAERTDTLTNGVAALRIKEMTAFALFYGPNAEKYVMPMQNEEGAWKMTQITPLHYPLGESTTAP